MPAKSAAKAIESTKPAPATSAPAKAAKAVAPKAEKPAEKAAPAEVAEKADKPAKSVKAPAAEKPAAEKPAKAEKPAEKAVSAEVVEKAEKPAKAAKAEKPAKEPVAAAAPAPAPAADAPAPAAEAPKATKKAESSSTSKVAVKAPEVFKPKPVKPVKAPPVNPDDPFDGIDELSEGQFLWQQIEVLKAERATYAAQSEMLRAEADQLAIDMEPGDVQFDDESGEGATVSIERERDLAMSANAAATVDDIDRALASIETGYYGYCETCHTAIRRDRLRAMPFATQCVACKSGGLSRR